MKTKELIEELQKLDPSGELDMMVNSDCHDYPVSMGHPKIAKIDEETDEWSYDEEGTECISVTADN